MTEQQTSRISLSRGLLAISPLLFAIVLFVGLSLYFGDFYKVPLLLLFVFASVWALCLMKGRTLDKRIALFSRYAAQEDLLLMVWIFVLAGAFAASAKAMGAVDAAVGLTLSVVPHDMLLAGLFLASCLVSLSVGTSVGTIVALAPVAVGLAGEAHFALPLVAGAVVGGAFFGDNLSFISDTTVAATKTLGCRMRDKFRANLYIALPAAVVALAVYVWIGASSGADVAGVEVEPLKVIPYVFVLLAAVFGLNVLAVLAFGVLLTGIMGFLTGAYGLNGWLQSIYSGITGMAELILISMLAGGLLGVVRSLGGIAWLLQVITRRVSSRRGAEYSIMLITVLTNLCTANNTIAILTSGPIARGIADRFHVDRRKAASILDTFSCCVQSVIPYGIQLLITSGLCSLSPSAIIPYLYYPFLLFFIALCSIQFHFPRLRG